METEINKDFYKYLPGMICVQLEDVYIKKFQKEDWFKTAWEEYRQHIKNSNTEDMMMPIFIFKKYIKE